MRENNYRRYRELGGIINEKDYESALTRAKNGATPDVARIKQARLIARFAGIEPRNQITTLYGILRADTAPAEVLCHHSQMSDQRLFAEALRMLGDVDALTKLISAHPQIDF